MKGATLFRFINTTLNRYKWHVKIALVGEEHDENWFMKKPRDTNYWIFLLKTLSCFMFSTSMANQEPVSSTFPDMHLHISRIKYRIY